MLHVLKLKIKSCICMYIFINTNILSDVYVCIYIHTYIHTYCQKSQLMVYVTWQKKINFFIP
jgi:hypothetical protein